MSTPDTPSPQAPAPAVQAAPMTREAFIALLREGLDWPEGSDPDGAAADALNRCADLYFAAKVPAPAVQEGSSNG